MSSYIDPAAAEQNADKVPGGRFEAISYDPIMAWAERSGMADRRRAALSAARGDVLEIGAGTGLNLPRYPVEIKSLTLVEPQVHMGAKINRRLAELGRDAAIVRATAEELPLESDSFDTVVSTFVLCTTPDPERALSEIRRVLRPDGTFLFLEHVRSDDARLSRWQDRLQGPWRAVAGGCNCNLATLDTIKAAGFEVNSLEQSTWPRMPPIVRPLINGAATSV